MRRLKTMNSKKVLKRRMANKRRQSKTWNIIHEDGREVIQQWRDKRIRLRGARKSYREMLVYSFHLDTFKSFLQNINFMVILQIIIACVSVYVFNHFDIHFEIPTTLLVAPIVFPLAFSINTDFQRRERVLEDLASFKSSGMIWYFCMREWKEAAGLDDEWMTAAHAKLKSLIFHLHEYLLTHKPDRRKLILSVLYEDFSDASQLVEKIRASKLPANPAIVSKAVSLLHGMCSSFERLRVVREYRSPRSIRSFNKVFITMLPIILAPYFVHLQRTDKNIGSSSCQPYYIAVVVAFVFSCLQGVQDKLDDPFDGMSEDDVNLDMIDEWVNGSLVHIMGRILQIGGYIDTFEDDTKLSEGCQKTDNCHEIPHNRKNGTINNPNFLSKPVENIHSKDEPFVHHIFSSLLSRMKSSPPKLTLDNHLGKNDDRNFLHDNNLDVSKAIINSTTSLNFENKHRSISKTDSSIVLSNYDVIHCDKRNSFLDKLKDEDDDTTVSDISISLSVDTPTKTDPNTVKKEHVCIDVSDYDERNGIAQMTENKWQVEMDSTDSTESSDTIATQIDDINSYITPSIKITPEIKTVRTDDVKLYVQAID